MPSVDIKALYQIDNDDLHKIELKSYKLPDQNLRRHSSSLVDSGNMFAQLMLT